MAIVARQFNNKWDPQSPIVDLPASGSAPQSRAVRSMPPPAAAPARTTGPPLGGRADDEPRYFLLRLLGYSNKLMAIKEVRSLTGLDLMSSKTLVEQPFPVVLQHSMDLEIAQRALDDFRQAGVTADLIPDPEP